MKLKNFKILAVIILLIILSCSKRPYNNIATGKISEIGICATKNVYSLIEKALLNALYEEMFLPVRESIFTTVYVDKEKLRIYRYSKNLIFLTNINRHDEYSDIINSFLSEENIQEIKKNKAMMFQVFDGFADGQNILIIAGVSEDALEKFIEINGTNIRKFFKNNCYRSIMKMMYLVGENKHLEKQIKSKVKIDIRIPSDYVSSFYDKDLNIYSIISHNPERVITMGFIDKNKYAFDYKTIVSLRNTIGAKYWNDDFIDTSYVKLNIDTIDFNNHKAIQVIGVWANDNGNYGGPFIGYIVDYKDKYLYLDGHILLPGERKFFKLIELKTIMFTIRGDSIAK